MINETSENNYLKVLDSNPKQVKSGGKSRTDGAQLGLVYLQLITPAHLDSLGGKKPWC